MDDNFIMTLMIFGVLSAIIFLVAYIFVSMFNRSLRPQRDAQRTPGADYTNMMILFQTMRDLLSQQKDLARQFNASVDKKVAGVRELVDAAKQEREALRAAQHEIAVLLQDAKDDLVSLQKQVGYLSDALEHGVREERPAPSPDSAPPRPERRAEDVVVPPPAPERARPEPEPEPETEPVEASDNGAKGDLIDNWSGFDFGGVVPAPEPEPEPEPAPPVHAPRRETKEELLAARDAVRSLLNFDTPQSAPEPEPRETDAPRNGNAHLTPLQRRVYEYSDAGMTVQDIARELGIGKGEIRLMLSLREQKQ